MPATATLRHVLPWRVRGRSASWCGSHARYRDGQTARILVEGDALFSVSTGVFFLARCALVLSHEARATKRLDTKKREKN